MNRASTHDDPGRKANLPARVLAVIPCLNEAAHIGDLLRRLMPAAERLDMLVVVADGNSTDGTQAIVSEFAARNPRVTLLTNPKRLQSAAVNLAVAKYGRERDCLIRIDAHGGYPDDYCDVLVAEALRASADSVVVSMKTEGEDGFQQAAALAQNSALGNGGSKHRAGARGHWTGHGHHALMDIAAFTAVGGYDETFSHNEDAELDHRLAAAGFRIWMTDRTAMTYYPRSTAGALFRQYLGYGRGRARNILKHRTVPGLRQMIPLGVAPAVGLALLAPMIPVAALPALLWAGACLAYGLWLTVGRGERHGLLAAWSAMIMHFAWSAGFWRQLLVAPFSRGAVASSVAGSGEAVR